MAKLVVTLILEDIEPNYSEQDAMQVLRQTLGRELPWTFGIIPQSWDPETYPPLGGE
jgi:hypothetical protein